MSKYFAFTLFLSLCSNASMAASSLCSAEEQVIWNCSTQKKTLSVCASKDLSATAGYMQYRIGQPNKLEMIFPEDQKHPKGLFEYGSLPAGAELSFQKDVYGYRIVTMRNGDSEMQVTQNDKDIAIIKCLDGTDIDGTLVGGILESAGISE